jgi:single-strand DNA-binding protein
MHKTNHCFLIGHLGADPVERSRSDKSGPIVGFPLAENVRSFDKEAGEYKTVHTNWFQVTAFGPLAERVKAGLKKGDRIAVQGQIKSSRYTDKSGEERTGFEIVADDVALWQTLGQSSHAVEAPRTQASIVRPNPQGKSARHEPMPF